MAGAGGGGPGLHPFCGEHPTKESLGGAFAEAEASAEMEAEDAGEVHEVGHVVNLEAKRFEDVAKFAGVQGGAHAVGKQVGVSEGFRWQESAKRDQWIRGIVEGQEELAAWGEDSDELAKAAMEFGPGFEVVERGDRDDPIEGMVRKWEGAGVGDARLQAGMPV